MIDGFPVHIVLVFDATVLVCLLFVWSAIRRVNRKIAVLVSIGVLAWITFQALLSNAGFYVVFDSVPPRFPVAVLPPLVVIIALFMWRQGRTFTDQLSLAMLTYLHVVRIPVELVLWWLYQEGHVPELMTFEGRNFDILAGITAPVVAYFCYTKSTWSLKVAVVWNGLALVLLFNIVIHAILAAPTPFQQIAFDQPNVGMFYVPFIWLPSFIVPVVLFSHLVSLRKLVQAQRSS